MGRWVGGSQERWVGGNTDRDVPWGWRWAGRVLNVWKCTLYKTVKGVPKGLVAVCSLLAREGGAVNHKLGIL